MKKTIRGILDWIESYSNSTESIFKRLEKKETTNRFQAVKDLKDTNLGIRRELVKLNDLWNSLTKEKPEIEKYRAYRVIKKCIEDIAKTASNLEIFSNEETGDYLGNTDVYCRDIRSNTGAIKTQLEGNISTLLY